MVAALSVDDDEALDQGEVLARLREDLEEGLLDDRDLGAGVGYAWTEYDGVSFRRSIPNRFVTNSVRIDDTDGNFAYQGIAGLSVPIPAVPGLAVTAEYRYFATLSPTLRGNAFAADGRRVGSVSFTPENDNHSLMLGIRYNFGQVARVRQPPPAVWTPRVDLESGLRETLDWWRAGGGLSAGARE